MFLKGFLLLGLVALAASDANGEPPRAGEELVFFPFDDHSVPLTKGLVLTLMPGRKSATNPGLGIDRDHPGKPVLAIGKKGDPDEKRVYFMGSVLYVEGTYHLWYTGHDGSSRQVCYAVSEDGLNWTKPDLGLVEYKGNKENNLVSLGEGEPMPGYSALVIHDPEDPDPARRFKMIREVSPNAIIASVSADGLSWQPAAGNEDIMKGCSLEPSGFIRHKGVYYLNGHGGPIPHPIATRGYMRPQKRMMVTLMSYDFEHWADAGIISFRRDNVPPRPPLDFEFHRGEQVHLGASLWDRGNVILGFYGQYHNETNDRRDAVVDLGLVVSNDGLHFREPLPDYKIVPSFEENDRAERRLTQGQAFQNIGNRTFVYYGIWPEIDRNSPTGVRVATWPKDRLGYFATPGHAKEGAHCVTAPFTPLSDNATVSLNATGLSEEGTLQVEVLDEFFQPLSGYTAADFQPIPHDSGLRFPVAWKGAETLKKWDHPIRLRTNWIGPHPEETKLWAVYVE